MIIFVSALRHRNVPSPPFYLFLISVARCAPEIRRCGRAVGLCERNWLWRDQIRRRSEHCTTPNRAASPQGWLAFTIWSALSVNTSRGSPEILLQIRSAGHRRASRVRACVMGQPARKWHRGGRHLTLRIASVSHTGNRFRLYQFDGTMTPTIDTWRPRDVARARVCVGTDAPMCARVRVHNTYACVIECACACERVFIGACLPYAPDSVVSVHNVSLIKTETSESMPTLVPNVLSYSNNNNENW